MIAIPSVHSDQPRTFVALMSKYLGEGGWGSFVSASKPEYGRKQTVHGKGTPCPSRSLPNYHLI